MSNSTTTENDIPKSKKDKMKLKQKKIRRKIYIKSILHKKISLSFQFIGENILENIKKKLSDTIEGKCCKEGYVKMNSIKIVNFSSGVIDGNDVIFEVTFECLICKPIIGQTIKCKIKNITKAGIRAQYYLDDYSPLTIYIARDNHYKNEYYNSITQNENQELKVKVIGVRYELNDNTIYVLGELLRIYKKKTSNEEKMKPKLQISQ